MLNKFVIMTAHMYPIEDVTCYLLIYMGLS